MLINTVSYIKFKLRIDLKCFIFKNLEDIRNPKKNLKILMENLSKNNLYLEIVI